MTGRDDSEATSRDPWAGNDIPVSSGLGNLDWLTPTSGDEPEVPAFSGGSDDERDEHGSPTASVEHAGSRRWAAAAIAVVSVAAGALIWSLLAGSDPSADTAPTTLPDLPDVSTPATSSPPTTARTPVETSPNDEPEGNEESLRGVVVTTTVEFTGAITSIAEPTELVGVTSDGRLVTIAVPSGVVQTVQLTDRPTPGSTGGAVVAAPDFTLVSLRNQFVVVDALGAIIEIDPDEFRVGGEDVRPPGLDLTRQGWIRRTDGTGVALVRAFGVGDQPQLFTVDAAGTVRTLDPDGNSSGAFGPPADGVRVVTDAGGSYRIDENGDATRVSDGFTFALAGERALQRRCDESLQCSTVVVDLADGTVTPTVLDGSSFFNDLSLSPDGEFVSFVSDEDGFARVLVDVASGEVVRGVQPFESGSGWAADSSGEFSLEAGSGIAFVPRDGGPVERIDLDLGRRFSFTSLDVRAGSTLSVPDALADLGGAATDDES